MDNNQNTGQKTPPAQPRSVATLTALGLIIILLAFYILYRGERVDNEEWLVKKAERINPAEQWSEKGLVKILGQPAGSFIQDELTGEKFVYLKKSVYKFEKVKKSKTEFITKNGKSQHVTKEILENDWVYKSGETLRANKLVMGKIEVLINEAKIMGDDEWKKTIYIHKGEKAEKSPEPPSPGDSKILLQGIKAEMPLLAVGNLQDGYLGSGDIFILSAFSEGKTMEELHKTMWIRSPFCFFMFIAGFIFLIYPAIVLLRNQQYPVLNTISRIGWPLFLFLSIIFSYLIVKYSQITVDLLWVIIVCIILIPVYKIYKSKSK